MILCLVNFVVQFQKMTKAQIKFIQSLSRQKYRKEYNAYLVEGDKNAKEWLQSEVHILQIVAIKGWLDENLPGMVERLVRAEIERVSRGR